MAAPKGYLAETRDEASPLSSEHPRKTISELRHVQCLILLGEPGLGKSVAIEEEVAHIEDAGGCVEFHDLKAYGDSTHVQQRIFESAKFQSLVSGQSLVLVLDSLDEGRLIMDNIAAFLFDELQRRLTRPDIKSRLKMRITCRSAEWPASLTAKLSDLFENDNVEVWQLAQLRKSDVILAAKDVDLNADAFVREIEAINATPLAIRPLTLNFLLSLKLQKGVLPRSQIDLYRLGLKLLCNEANDHRRELGSHKSIGELDSLHRLAIARRLAALSIFCQKPFISVQEGPFTTDQVLQLSEICPIGSTETDGQSAFPFKVRDVQEVLRTGLFRVAGPGFVTWAHQTYAEFLAAEYLSIRRVEVAQVEALLRVSTHEKPIAPQLLETSAWLASMEPAFARQYFKSDLAVLLRSDLLMMEDAVRQHLAERLLEAVHKRQNNDDRLRRYYFKLASVGLADVLRRHILKFRSDSDVLYAVLAIAHDCTLRDLAEDIIALALDEQQPTSLRCIAIEVLANIASSDEKRRLAPLVEHPDDEVHAQALKLLWPGALSTVEMLSKLRVATRQPHGFHGRFVREGLIARLKDQDLDATLRWMSTIVAQYPNPHEPLLQAGEELTLYNLRRCLSGIYSLAVGTTSVDTIVATANFVCAVIDNPDWQLDVAGPVREYREVSPVTSVRRAIALGIVAGLKSGRRHAAMLVRQFPYFVPDDFFWLMDVALQEQEPDIRKLEVDVIFLIRDETSYPQFEALFNFIDRCGEMAVREEQLCACVIDERTATRSLEAAKREIGANAVTSSSSAIKARIDAYLYALDAGRQEAWWLLLRYIACEAEDPSHVAHRKGIERLSPWRLVDAPSSKIRAYALSYLGSYDPGLSNWWPDKEGIYWPAYAGYRALEYLVDSIDDLLALPVQVWRTWAPVVLGFPMDDVDHSRILKIICHKVVPKEYCSRLRELWEVTSGEFDLARHVSGIWDGDIGDLIADRILKLDPDDYNFTYGIELLLSQKHPVGASLVQSAIDSKLPSWQQVAVLQTALKQNQGKRWSELWPKIALDRDLGMLVLLSSKEWSAKNALTAQDLADVYEFIWRDERVQNLIHAKRGRHFVEAIPRQLAAMGTTASLDSLIHMRQSFRDHTWLPHCIEECRENLSRAEWKPVPSKALLAIVEDREKRIVRSTSELLDVVEHSLNRFQKQLFASPPSIGDIWNTSRGAFTPKDENEVSDVIVRFLRGDIGGRGISQ